VTAICTRAGQRVKLSAIEPTGWAFSKLQRNTALTRADNIHPVKVALGDCDQARLNCASDPVSV
jgi:FkbM family methyltransferase